MSQDIGARAAVHIFNRISIAIAKGLRAQIEEVEQVIMVRTNIGRGGRGGRGLSDHEAARGVQEPIGKDEPNTDVSQRRRGSTLSNKFTDPKVSRKITSILKTMFNGSWTTWKEVDKSARDEFWAHFKNYLDSVRGELKEEMKVDLKEEMKVGLKEEMKNELKEEMREELKEEMRAELKEEMRANACRNSRYAC
ncbi:hypothetical protein Tco_1237629 [Tanacetum coccineum]